GTASGSFSPATSCNLVAGSCSVTFTPTGAGTDTVTANYQGDNVHSTSSGTSGTITSTLRTSSIGISCPATTLVNSPAACTVTVTDTSPPPDLTPTGTITFTTNSTGTFTTCTLSGAGASATCTTSYSPTTTGTGSHKLTAYYGGDAGHYAASPNATATVTVNVRSLTSALNCQSPGTIGVATTCTVTVTDNSPGTFITPTGEVILTTSGSGTFTGTCTLSGTTASASCSITYTPSGTAATNDLISYSYPGDTNHTANSGNFLLVVNPPSPPPPGATSTSFLGLQTDYWIILAVALAVVGVFMGYFVMSKKKRNQQSFQPSSSHTTPSSPGLISTEPVTNPQPTTSPQASASAQSAPAPQPTTNTQPATAQPAPSTQPAPGTLPAIGTQPAAGTQPPASTPPDKT
ncbi:MAG TPA: Ig-like domain repeat protein, partial [Candidatus Bathyarchaeia archaeon]